MNNPPAMNVANEIPVPRIRQQRETLEARPYTEDRRIIRSPARKKSRAKNDHHDFSYPLVVAFFATCFKCISAESHQSKIRLTNHAISRQSVFSMKSILAWRNRAIYKSVAAACCAIWLLSGCSSVAIDATKGQTYYTQFSLFYEGGIYKTVNYRIGALLPINTPVVLLDFNHAVILVKLPDGAKLRLLNIAKFSRDTLSDEFTRTFGRERVDLAKFSPKERENILAGAVQVGMSKEAVIKAMGYPPGFRTPSLDMNQWKYWKNRYGTMLVFFVDGKVSNIKR
jgi:hypothetical protein